ncbi:MAG: HAMP domain-containing sensor histidine kinase [Pseudomonadota bacterium]
MSSAASSSLWRSSSLRLALLLTLVIWLTSAGVIVAIVAASERTLLNPLSERVNGEISFLIDQLNGEELELYEWFDGEFEPLFVETAFIDVDDPEIFLQEYAALLRELEVDGTPQRASIQARLWLIQQGKDLSAINRPFQFYLALAKEEIPEEHHEWFVENFERHWRSWPKAWRWESMNLGQRVDLILSGLKDQREEHDRCVTESDEEFGEPWETVGLSAASYSAFIIDDVVRFNDEQTLCWARTLTLGDARELTLGVHATETINAVRTNRLWRNIGVGASLLLAIGLGSLLGHRVYARVRTIHSLTEKVRLGNLEHRLRLNGSGDDFDLLSGNINEMLDKIVSLMNGVRQVSDNIAHDLRSPLTRLRNRIEQLQRIESPTAEDIRPIAEQADEVLTTFTALLRIAQLEQGSQRQPFEAIDLGELIREVSDLYEPVFAESDIRLVAEVPSDPSWITGDRSLWSQVLINLLENALRYAPDSPSVSVALRAAGHAWIVTIQDRGPGVPDHSLQRLTERFYRGESNRQPGGTGLGLSLVAAICSIHEAALSFSNDGGLQVQIRIPKRH